MKGIKQYLQSTEDIKSIIHGVEGGIKEQLIAGLSGTARSILASIIHDQVQRPTLLITYQLNQAQQLYEDLLEFIDENKVYLYPANELIASDIAVASPELKSQRIDALTKWRQHKDAVLIAPVAALKRILPPQQYWETYQLSFQVGKEIDIDHYLLSLVAMGYERTSMVTTPGEFSVRGGIIDIYPITKEHPIRIELFDEEIDSIRFFDADTQRSLDKLDSIYISPSTEMPLTDSDIYTTIERMEESLAGQLKKMKASKNKEKLIETIQNDIERFKQERHFPEMYKYTSFFYEETTSLLDYLSEDGLLLFDELSRVQEAAESLDKEELEWHSSLIEASEMIPHNRVQLTWDHIRSHFTHQRIYMSVFLRHIPNTQPQNIVNISSREMQQFHSQMNLFKNELQRWEKGNFSVVICVPSEKRAVKIKELFADYDITASIEDDLSLPVTHPAIVVGNLQSGIEFSMYKLVVITEKELFKKSTTRRRKTQKISNAERIKNYQELKVGDYVVHTGHGIGRYLGIETVEINGMHKDYLLIKYMGDDKLYVPVDQIDLVQKFVGSEGKEPKLYKLGGSEWAKVKSRVQSSVEDIADDLIKLYAEREARKGFAFSPDTDMQQEFEENFAYRETDDQIRCIAEIKEDMERDRPMDRLLCGDVGYGKTEVALRAAFKAVADGKQVAILVPTTILAQQHYQTILERFQNYPVTVGMLSRFRTKKQQEETLKGLKRGTVDIVVGTHRLLSKDVVYRDLGLLVVDEEQRFGVKHKEKIKQLKSNIDVLTLTATPIPRTLHMSMLGVRDLSVIETPPENRFPIQTYVLEYNPIFIKEAIERELSRGGQVYFLFNRVENIEGIAREISGYVEGVSVAVAHGQMNESELENIMLRFLEGEFDVLVSTTIIETGVDIPNVNTLIVYDADKMGLSQLYQLRGRVGRSNRVAYAHFTYQRDKVLTEIAEKRLQAIKEFTELGSGFKIAMRDLSIRGAGNLLGSQQHGFIDSVGFDMYSQMLKEAIDARKTGKSLDEIVIFEPELGLEVDAYIPSAYISDEKQKIDMYKKFHSVQSSEEIIELQDELIDRFGDYPKEVDSLFSVAALRMYAKRERVESITESKQKIELLIEENRSQNIDGSKLFALANDFEGEILLGTEQNKIKITFKFASKIDTTSKYISLENFMAKLHAVDRSG